jgi:hypothetical protein
LDIYRVLEGIKESERGEIQKAIMNQVSVYLENETVSQQVIHNESFKQQSRFPDNQKEIQLSFAKIDSLRETDLVILNSDYIKGNEIFAIGGATDESYYSESSRNIPIPIRNLWSEKLAYRSSNSSAIASRDGILEIRLLFMGTQTRDSWDGIAISLRESLGNPSMDRHDLLELLGDIWAEFITDIEAEPAGWEQVTNVLRKENRGMLEDDFMSPYRFLESLRSGKLEPGFTDLCLLVRSSRTPATLGFILLHGYSVGEDMVSVRYPMRVIGGPPPLWNEYQYSILMRTPDRTEQERYSYAPCLGVRKMGSEPIYSFKPGKNHLPGQFTTMAQANADSGKPPRWTDPKRPKWTQTHFGLKRR